MRFGECPSESTRTIEADFKQYGWNGEGDIFVLETLYAYGLRFLSEWISLYDGDISFYCMSETEIMVISLICIGTVVIFFGLGIMSFLMKEKKDDAGDISDNHSFTLNQIK